MTIFSNSPCRSAILFPVIRRLVATLIFVLSANFASAENTNMPLSGDIATNRTLVERFFATIESGDFSEFDEIVAENYNDHLAGQTPGREALKRYFGALHVAFPDVSLPILYMIAEGDKVAVLNEVIGTNTGPFGGAKPTGNKIKVQAFQLYRIENGQLAEHWEVADFATMLKQLYP